jgi:uncharacterized protein YwgA
MIEKFRWLAAIIAAHPQRKVVGRTRLQKTVKLLQRLKFPTDYRYMTHFYGPYSEGVHADIGLLKHFGLVEEEENQAQDGSPYYILTASEDASLAAEVKPFKPYIDKLQSTDPVVLELAATYDSFREMGSDHAKAIERLRRKKGSKCENGNEEKALKLLRELKLPTT